MRLARGFTGVALGLASMGLLPAAVVSYGNRAAWLAATSGVTTIDFEGLVPAAGSFLYPNPAGLTLSGVKFSDALNQMYVFDSAYSPGNTNWGSGASLITNASNDTVTVKLPGTGATALGTDFYTVNAPGQSMLIMLSTGDVFVMPTASHPTRTFVGFTSPIPITKATFFGIGAATGLDNVGFGSRGSTPVPEPATGILVGIGLAMAMAGRRPMLGRETVGGNAPLR